MEDKGRFVGDDTITSNSAGYWYDDKKTFVQRYGMEIRKCTNVREITGDELKQLLEQNRWEEDGIKFYYSPTVYLYKKEDWNEMYDEKTDTNEGAIKEILEDIIPSLIEE